MLEAVWRTIASVLQKKGSGYGDWIRPKTAKALKDELKDLIAVEAFEWTMPSRGKHGKHNKVREMLLQGAKELCKETLPSCSHADVSTEVNNDGADNGDARIEDEPTTVVRKTIQTTSMAPSKLPMTKEVREKCLANCGECKTF